MGNGKTCPHFPNASRKNGQLTPTDFAESVAVGRKPQRLIPLERFSSTKDLTENFGCSADADGFPQYMTLEERFERYLGRSPRIHESAFVARSSILAGAVVIGQQSSVWPLCVLRADINSIEIGDCSNIQDGTIVHLADDYGVKIGNHVTVGHAAMIHACTIEDECLIGMRATILDGAVIGKGSIVGAGALVTKGTVIPPGSLVLGMPAKVLRSLTEAERSSTRELAEKYVQVAAEHKRRGTL